MRPKLTSDSDLLDAARDCFLEYGPSVSTTLIAERAGVSQATIFKRFGTKAQLLMLALGYEEMLPWLPKVEAGPDDRPIREQLMELAQALTAFYIESLPSMMALWSAGPSYFADVPGPSDDPREASLAVRSRLMLSDWFAKAQSTGRVGQCNPEAIGIAFLGACQAPAMRLHLGEDNIDVQCYLNSFLDILLNGISG